MKYDYDEESKKLVEDIMKDREALRQKGIKREKQEKNIFRKIIRKLLTLFE